MILAILCSCTFDIQKSSGRAAIELSFKAGSVFSLGVSDDLQVVYVNPEGSDAENVLANYYKFSEGPLSYVVESLAIANSSAKVEGCHDIEITVISGFADKEAVASSLSAASEFLNVNTSGNFKMLFEGREITVDAAPHDYYSVCENCDGFGVVTCTTCGGVNTQCTECKGLGQIWEKCENCDGKGTVKSGDKCESCDGKGGRDVTCEVCSGNGVVNNCTTCEGTGVIACPVCNGTGDKPFEK